MDARTSCLERCAKLAHAYTTYTHAYTAKLRAVVERSELRSRYAIGYVTVLSQLVRFVQLWRMHVAHYPSLPNVPESELWLNDSSVLFSVYFPSPPTTVLGERGGGVVAHGGHASMGA